LRLTLRELRILDDAKLLADWDQTTAINVGIQHLTSVVVNALSKNAKIKPSSFEDMHPYRQKTQQRGLQITHKNFKSLKKIIGAVCR